MKVGDIMTPRVYALRSNDTLAHARKMMLTHGVGHILVVGDDDKLEGIITKKDLSHKVVEQGADVDPLNKLLVSMVMTRKTITVEPSSEVKHAAQLMIDNEISSLPVVDNEGHSLGILTKSDILNFFFRHMKGVGKVEDYMNNEVYSVAPTHSLNHIMRVMEENGGVDQVLVMDDDRIVGMVSQADILFSTVTNLSGPRGNFINKRPEAGSRKWMRSLKYVPAVIAEDIMSENPVVVSSSADLSDAAHLMVESHISALPVMENERVCGVITKRDIIKALAKS